MTMDTWYNLLKWTHPIHITLVVLVSTPRKVVCLAIERWLLL